MIGGRDGQIRTADLSLRRRPLYPSELRPRYLDSKLLQFSDVPRDAARRARRRSRHRGNRIPMATGLAPSQGSPRHRRALATLMGADKGRRFTRGSLTPLEQVSTITRVSPPRENQRNTGGLGAESRTFFVRYVPAVDRKDESRLKDWEIYAILIRTLSADEAGPFFSSLTAIPSVVSSQGSAPSNMKAICCGVELTATNCSSP
jgi:hypothetical protein